MTRRLFALQEDDWQIVPLPDDQRDGNVPVVEDDPTKDLSGKDPEIPYAP